MESDWDENAFLEQTKEYQLVYIFSERPLLVTSASIQLVDTKITYQKLVPDSNEMPSGIGPYRGKKSDKLLALAFDSGGHSRFKIDQRLIHGEFEKLYSLWIKKALDSDSILEAHSLQGMISYDAGEAGVSIGLIAVSKESRGQGWGKKLMKAVEYKAFCQGAKSLSVSTQEANTPACNLYESLGYQLKNKVHVYHYWNNGQ